MNQVKRVTSFQVRTIVLKQGYNMIRVFGSHEGRLVSFLTWQEKNVNGKLMTFLNMGMKIECAK